MPETLVSAANRGLSTFGRMALPGELFAHARSHAVARQPPDHPDHKAQLFASRAWRATDFPRRGRYISVARPVRVFGVGDTMTERSSEGLDSRRRKLLFQA